MGDGQIVIKVVLIAVFAAFAVVVLLPGRGARKLAVKRLALVALFGLAIVAVMFPQLTNAVAQAVGVGRGTDLLLYGLVIVFVGNAISTSLRFRHQEREVTQLARAAALRDAERPWETSGESDSKPR
jgi:small membrane protein